MREYINIYIDTVCNTKNTKEAYMRDLKSMVEFIDKPIHEVTIFDVTNWKNSMANMSSATVARKLGSAKRFFTFLYDNGYIEVNPTKAVKLPKITNKEEETLTRGEVDALMSACKNPRDTAILAMLVSTGLRIAELCNIMIDDIDENNNIKILGKGSKWRLVHLNDKVKGYVDEYIAVRKDSGDCDNLFVSNFGTPMTQHTINHTLKTLAKRAGLECNVHPHMLRHYFATETLEHGVPIDMISIALGHSNVAVTQRYAQRRDRQSVVEDVMNLEVC